MAAASRSVVQGTGTEYGVLYLGRYNYHTLDPIIEMENSTR
jgi:hypothetical protein